MLLLEQHMNYFYGFLFSIENFIYKKKLINDVLKPKEITISRLIQNSNKSLQFMIFINQFLIINTLCRF